MQDSEIIISLLRDRFDSLDRRLDQLHGALGTQADSFNHLAQHVGKQNGRIGKVEDWVQHHEHATERQQDSIQHRLGRWATVIAALGGGATVWGLTLLTGMH